MFRAANVHSQILRLQGVCHDIYRMLHHFVETTFRADQNHLIMPEKSVIMILHCYPLTVRALAFSFSKRMVELHLHIVNNGSVCHLIRIFYLNCVKYVSSVGRLY